MRNLGRSQPWYPLLPRCRKCRHITPSPASTGIHLSHWPWCDEAEPDAKARWERRNELRALRTIGRLV